jgi:multicomponent K+:H+ antiporter subunit E
MKTRPTLRQTVLPAPLLSAALLLTWLMLNESVSVGNLLLGSAVALVLPWVTRALLPEPLRVRSWRSAVYLAGVVLFDIAKSNIDVARRVLGPEAAMQPRFVWVPLSVTNPHAIVALAAIITLTPGTVSSELSEDRRWLLVHALHCPDAESQAALVADIKARYEQPLLEIFE